MSNKNLEIYDPTNRPMLDLYAPQQDMSFSQIVGVIWKKKAAIALAATLLATVSFAVVSTQRPSYEASGTMGIDTSQITNPLLRDAASPTSQAVAEPAIARSFLALMTSNDLTERMVARLDLMKDPELNPTLPREREPTWIDAALAPVKQLRAELIARGILGAAKEPTPEQVRLLVVESFRNRLKVTNDGRSYTIQVTYTSEDPQRAADVVNATMEEGAALVSASKRGTGEQANAWFTERVQALQGDVSTASERLRNFRDEIGMTDANGPSLPSQQLAVLSTRLTEARAELSQLRARYDQAMADVRTRGFHADIDPVLASPTIVNLRQREMALLERHAELESRLGPKHPSLQAAGAELERVRGQVASEQGKILRSMEHQVVSATASVRTMEQQVEQLRAAAQKVASRTGEMAVLEEDLRAKQNILENFLSGSAVAYGSMVLDAGGVRILSRAAESLRPASMGATIMALIAALAGALLATIGILVRAQLDRGFDSSDELESSTGIPVVGAIPRAKRWGRSERPIAQIVREPFGSVAETLRGVVSILPTIQRNARSITLMVTSSQPGEGKTAIVAAMAQVSGCDGLRVIALDCDLRNSSIANHFGRSEGPGIEDVLDGSVDWREAVRSTPDGTTDFLRVVRRPDNPTVLLRSFEWKRMIGELREHYDLIIIDTPPIMNVSDASVIGWEADIVLMVVGWRRTLRKTVKAALKRLLVPNGPATLMVLNGVGAEQVAGSYVGYGVYRRLGWLLPSGGGQVPMGGSAR